MDCAEQADSSKGGALQRKEVAVSLAPFPLRHPKAASTQRARQECRAAARASSIESTPRAGTCGGSITKYLSTSSSLSCASTHRVALVACTKHRTDVGSTRTSSKAPSIRPAAPRRPRLSAHPYTEIRRRAVITTNRRLLTHKPSSLSRHTEAKALVVHSSHIWRRRADSRHLYSASAKTVWHRRSVGQLPVWHSRRRCATSYTAGQRRLLQRKILGICHHKYI